MEIYDVGGNNPKARYQDLLDKLDDYSRITEAETILESMIFEESSFQKTLKLSKDIFQNTLLMT